MRVGRCVVTFVAGGAALWLCLQAILIFGVEKKTFLQLFLDILGGGAVGAAAGVVFFIVVGAIGFVSGAVYGALGLFSLALGGALTGLGLGSIVHILRNPDQYSFNVPVIVVGALVTCFICRWVTVKVGKLYDEHGPKIVEWLINKNKPEA